MVIPLLPLNPELTGTIVGIMVDPHSNLIPDLREIIDSPQGLHHWILDEI